MESNNWFVKGLGKTRADIIESTFINAEEKTVALYAVKVLVDQLEKELGVLIHPTPYIEVAIDFVDASDDYAAFSLQIKNKNKNLVDNKMHFEIQVEGGTVCILTGESGDVETSFSNLLGILYLWSFWKDEEGEV